MNESGRTRAEELAISIVDRYRNLCLAHNVDPPQIITLQGWIYEALRMMYENRTRF